MFNFRLKINEIKSTKNLINLSILYYLFFCIQYNFISS